MARGFPKGCPVPENQRRRILHAFVLGKNKGTCTRCKSLGDLTEHYRNLPCPHMKWAGKHAKPMWKH